MLMILLNIIYIIFFLFALFPALIYAILGWLETKENIKRKSWFKKITKSLKFSSKTTQITMRKKWKLVRFKFSEERAETFKILLADHHLLKNINVHMNNEEML